jgi:hypothetical protein
VGFEDPYSAARTSGWLGKSPASITPNIGLDPVTGGGVKDAAPIAGNAHCAPNKGSAE